MSGLTQETALPRPALGWQRSHLGLECPLLATLGKEAYTAGLLDHFLCWRAEPIAAAVMTQASHSIYSEENDISTTAKAAF